MIKLCEDCNYTVLIADLIETLSSMDKFFVRIWITGTEVPFNFNSDKDFEFLQEGLKVVGENDIDYIFYDTIATIKVIK